MSHLFLSKDVCNILCPAVAQYGGSFGLRYNFESGEYGSSEADSSSSDSDPDATTTAEQESDNATDDDGHIDVAEVIQSTSPKRNRHAITMKKPTKRKAPAPSKSSVAAKKADCERDLGGEARSICGGSTHGRFTHDHSQLDSQVFTQLS